MDDILNPTFILAKAVTALTGALTTLAPPLAPFAFAILVYMLAQAIPLAAVKAGCQGNQASKGVWESMAWVLPGTFIPTCIF